MSTSHLMYIYVYVYEIYILMCSFVHSILHIVYTKSTLLKLLIPGNVTKNDNKKIKKYKNSISKFPKLPCYLSINFSILLYVYLIVMYLDITKKSKNSQIV